METKFSPDRLYRYTLARQWEPGGMVNFIMLNPSTADEVKNDPTVERCERRARRWGYGGLIVTNIFAYRSTDPKALYKIEDPVGPENDAAIVEAATASKMVICAWGTHGNLKHRWIEVIRLLDMASITPHYLRLAKDGNPCHPLYLPYSLEPQPIPKDHVFYL